MARQRISSPNQAKVVGIWIRVSTEDQARGESPEHHEKRASYYAESKGWQVAEVYHLEGVSGKSVLQHPETQRMLSDVRSGRISGLIFSKIARLARNTRELLDFADEFERHSADLISLQESIDTSTPAGRLFYTIIAAMAQWEREEISDRVAASIPIRAKLGKPLGGRAPFGNRWRDKRLVLDEKEAPVRKLMFELFLEHKRKKTVARLLNNAGYRTRRGERFSSATIGRLISDPIAKGIRRANLTRSIARGGGFKPADEWVYVEAPALVSEELWDRCNAILQSQDAPGKRPAKKAAHLFSGLVFCHCGKKMYVRWKSRNYSCDECLNKVGEEDLEVVFDEQMKGVLFSEDQITEHLERADQRIVEKRELLDTLGAEKQTLAAEMDRLYRLYVEGNISGRLFAERNAPLEERLRQLEEEIPRLAGEIDYLRLQVLSADEVVIEARDLHARWATLLFDEKRQIVEGITDRIVVGNSEISIHLAYLSATQGSSQDTANRAHNPRGTAPR